MSFLVWGLGKSGKAAVKLLKKKGYKVYTGDDKENPQLWKEVLGEVDTVVLSPGVPPSHPLWREAEKLGKEVIGETELAYRFFKGKVIAITGTDGKSTTTRLTYLILKEFLPKVHEGGNIGRPFSDIVLDSEDGFAVLEISSFQGKTLKIFRPQLGAFVSFARDHLDWHPNMEDYLRSKYKIFQNQKPEDILILNDSFEEIKRTPSEAQKILLSELKISEEAVYYRGKKLFSPKHLKIKGFHSVINASVVSLIALNFGIEPTDFEEILYEFRGLPYRLEYLGKVKDLEVYNDAKSTTVNALISALRSFPDRRIILIVGGKDKGDDFSVAVPYLKNVKLVLAIGETKEKIKESFKDFVEVITCGSLEEAVDKAFERRGQGEILLFSPACSSFDMFRNYVERGEKFKELIEKKKKEGLHTEV